MVQKIIKESKLYPGLLHNIPNPPKSLYVKGNVSSDSFSNCLGVVGSRSMTPYGERVVRYILSGLVLSGICIVSGFMYGVDAAAHSYALEYGLSTIAVMPCGVDSIYPRSQKDLYSKIISSGNLIMSEYKGSISPKKWVFPRRNRLVAGICKAILVVEAAVDSGSLITTDYAVLFGRKVFSVPGSIFSNVSKGTNKIIGSTAEIVDSSKKIYEYFCSVGDLKKRQNTSLVINKSHIDHIHDKNALENNILEFLNTNPASINLLLSHFEGEKDKLYNIVTLMEIKGLIRNEQGIYYVC